MLRISRSTAVLVLILTIGALLLAPDAALAQAGGGLPWETPLKTLSRSVAGPVAYAVSLMGIVVAGATLVFGGEINEFVRRVIMLILVVSLILFASNILTSLFQASGAGGLTTVQAASQAGAA